MPSETRWIIVFLGLVAAFTASAQVMDGTEFNVDESGLAIEGYDPVAYFTLGEATPGSPEFSTEHNGVTFYFASAAHRTMFMETPDRFIPAYGAWCAWAASRDSLAAIDPRQFVIHDDRLFLNYNARLNRRFAGKLENNIQRADDNWPDLSEEASAR